MPLKFVFLPKGFFENWKSFMTETTLICTPKRSFLNEICTAHICMTPMESNQVCGSDNHTNAQISKSSSPWVIDSCLWPSPSFSTLPLNHACKPKNIPVTPYTYINLCVCPEGSWICFEGSLLEVRLNLYLSPGFISLQHASSQVKVTLPWGLRATELLPMHLLSLPLLQCGLTGVP